MTISLKLLSSDLQTRETRGLDALRLGPPISSEQLADIRLLATLPTEHMDRLIRAIVAEVEAIDGISIFTDKSLQRFLEDRTK